MWWNAPWDKYINRSEGRIAKDIKTEFNKIDKLIYRDDQEVYQAWINMAKLYQKQMLSAKYLLTKKEKYIVKDWKAVLFQYGNDYWRAAKRFLDNAINSFISKYKNVKGRIKFTSERERTILISNVARDLNKAEDRALQEIERYCNPRQEQDNTQEHSEVVRDRQWKVKVENWEIVRQKPLFNQSPDWTIIFTDRVNPIKINQALGNLFRNKNAIYRINYSNCKNPKIKSKMKSLIWWLSCWVKYDDKQKTYVLTDQTWRILSNRALVWEWVTMKRDSIIESQSKDNKITGNEGESLENVRSTLKTFTYDANNYTFYPQYRNTLGDINICSAYAYWCVSDILAKQNLCFAATEVNAWDISSSGPIKKNFSINQINSNNPKQQIISAPAGSFLTVRYNKSHAREQWVTHVMVSLGNGVYTDLFGANIRRIDFKSEVSFSWRGFTYRWSSFSFTQDARLMTPKLWTLPVWKEQTISLGKVWTPEELVEKVHWETGADKNYIRMLISRQHNIPPSKFNIRYKNLSVKIVLKEVEEMNISNREWSNDVSQIFLASIRINKTKLMQHYHWLTNNEYDEIAKRAMWILYQETKAWDSIEYKWKELAHNIGVTKLSSRDWSRWYTQIKFDQIFNDSDKKFLRNFWINSENDLDDPAKSAIATMVWLINNYYNTILPMKLDNFRTNDAKIIRVTFKDGKHEDIAIWKTIMIDGVKRARTPEEIESKINEWSEKHWWVASRETITRKWLGDKAFFDMVYYAWNSPSEIKYWTATWEKGSYAYKADNFANEHVA